MCKSRGKLSHKLLYFIVLQSFYALTSSQNSYSPDNAFADIYFDSNDTILCEFDQTINITDGSLQVDRSWLHDGLHYGLGYYAKYNYTLTDEGIKIPANEHIRGCICLLKPCIYACCEPKHTTDNKTGTCLSNQYDKLWWDVGMPGEEPKNIEITKEFYWKYRKLTCKDKHYLDPNQYEYDAWWLAQNGSIYVADDESFLNYDEHCVAVDEETKTLLVLKCYEPMEASSRFRMLGIGMLLSVPFLLVTFIVYAVIPELRNVHGMSLMSYVGGLTVGYTFLATIQIIGSREACHTGEERCYDPNFCTISGYIIYFSFMLSFFWLNTMCFDIYWTFRGVRSNTSAKKNFMYYCVYAWGMASFITILALSIDISNVNQEYKPGMYYTQTCFLSHNKLVEFLYLYMILLILVCSNITFFVVTALRIKRVQRETAAVVDAGNSGRHSRQNYDNYRFMLYLRLFIIMGVTWSMELLSWVISHDSPWFYASDLVNCLQGVLIFLLVVCNDKVRRLVIKRGIVPPETGTTFSDTRNSRISSSFHRNNSIQLENRTTKKTKLKIIFTDVTSVFHTKNITGGKLFHNGSYHHEGLLYPPGHFGHFKTMLHENLIETATELHVRGCICTHSKKRCIRVCCSGDENGIIPEICPQEVKAVSDNKSIQRLTNSHILTYNDLDCKIKVEKEISHIHENGSIYLSDDQSFMNYNDHCVAVDNESKSLIVLTCCKSESSSLLEMAMLFSVPFLIATFILYAVIPELRNVHGMSLMSYVGALIVGYTLLASYKLSIAHFQCQMQEGLFHDPHFCTISGYVIYFSFILSFFWLNTMCFDIFKTFSGVRSNTSAKKNFRYYCVYAWGMASFITILAVSIDISNAPQDYKPGMYFTQTCFLSHTKLVEFLYLYMILLVLFCSNTFFFVVTAIRIRKSESDITNVVNAGSSRRHSRQTSNDTYRVWLYFRLFIIMGVTWFTELISWVVSNDIWFYATDIVNCLQGVLIFLLAVCNGKVRRLLIKRFRKSGAKIRSETSDTRQSRFSRSYRNNSIELENRSGSLNNRDIKN
uniref:CSON004731 protein n=1 Tax=Culicoides sonorensis TaxID=179676 RepID=A0A336LUJ7_CULSO